MLGILSHIVCKLFSAEVISAVPKLFGYSQIHTLLPSIKAWITSKTPTGLTPIALIWCSVLPISTVEYQTLTLPVYHES